MTYLMSFGEFFLLLLLLGFILLIWFIFIWLMRKFGGTSIVTRGNYHNAQIGSQISRARLEKLMITDPEGVKKAIELCKRKVYNLTPENILDEYENVLNGNFNTFFTRAGKFWLGIKKFINRLMR